MIPSSPPQGPHQDELALARQIQAGDEDAFVEPLGYLSPGRVCGWR